MNNFLSNKRNTKLEAIGNFISVIGLTISQNVFGIFEVKYIFHRIVWTPVLQSLIKKNIILNVY